MSDTRPDVPAAKADAGDARPEAPVTIYTRQLCGFCTAAKRLLASKDIAFDERDATFDPTLRQEMMQRSGRSTFPQIFIGAAHVGGCDDLMALERAGRLDAMLAGDGPSAGDGPGAG